MLNPQDYPLWLGYTDMPTFLQDPITMVKAEGVTLIDDQGKRYLDLESGIRNVLLGYSQEEITKAIYEQLARLPYTRSAHFGNDAALQLAKQLASVSPVKNPRILFHNSGSEAVEASIKLVRQLAFLKNDKRNFIISFKGGYHGQTITALSASGEEYSKEPFAPLTKGFIFLDFPKSFSEVTKVEEILQKDPYVGAIIVEPILGNGGVIPLPEGYLSKLSRICDKYQLLLICDEISTGFGRCGKWFLSEECSPDILVVGKALTNGYLPLSAVIVSENVWQTFDQHGNFRHGQTNLNHPACCAAGLATLKILFNLNAPKICLEKGNQISESLKELQLNGRVKSLRGKGLLWGIVFDEAIHNKHDSNKWLQLLMLEKGFIIGQIENTIFLSPSLVIEESHISNFMKWFKEALG